MMRGTQGPKLTIEDRERLRTQQKEIAQAAWIKHEEAALGNFERIYPDDDPQRSAMYERTLAGSVQLFGRSATNRRTAASSVPPKKVEEQQKKPAVKRLQAAAKAVSSTDTNSSASSTIGDSSVAGSLESGDTPTGAAKDGQQPTAAAIAAAIANADDKAAAAIAAAACFLGMPSEGSEGGPSAADVPYCGLTGGYPANGILPGSASCAMAAPVSAPSAAYDTASGSGGPESPSHGGSSTTARNPFFRLMNPSMGGIPMHCTTEPHDDSRGARPSAGVAAPAGAPLGHMGAVGVGQTTESMCTYGYGLHWRCPSIHEVSAISRTRGDRGGGRDGSAAMPPSASPISGHKDGQGGAACSTAAGAARLELLARMEQLEARRKTSNSTSNGCSSGGGGGGTATSGNVGAPASASGGSAAPASGDYRPGSRNGRDRPGSEGASATDKAMPGGTTAAGNGVNVPSRSSLMRSACLAAPALMAN